MGEFTDQTNQRNEWAPDGCLAFETPRNSFPIMTTIAERADHLEKALDRMVAVLVKEYRPEKIILFGSFASGMVHEGSDLDLLIIKETTKRPIDRQVEVYGLVKPEIGIDLFIYTPQEFRYLESIGFSLVKEMVANGKVLYEAGDTGMAQDRR